LPSVQHRYQSRTVRDYTRDKIIFLFIFNYLYRFNRFSTLPRLALAQNLQGYDQEITETEVAMVVYLDQYRKAKAANVMAARCYDRAKLCVNGHPSTGAIAMLSTQNASDLSPELPEDFTQVDVEAFLGRVYALASQI
jgi:hypothetical protein